MRRRTFVASVFSGFCAYLSGCSGQLPGQKTSQREIRTPGAPDCDGPPQDRITVVNRIPASVVAHVSVENEEATILYSEEISLPPADEGNASSPTFTSDTVISEQGTYLVTVNVREPYTLTHKYEREYATECDRWELLIKQGDVSNVKIPLEG